MTVRDLLCLLGPILAERREPPPAAAPNARRLKVNAPDEFDGRNPKKLKSFLVSCNNAFRADPDTFRHHDKRVSYALSYLCGSAQRHFDTQLEDEDEVAFIPPQLAKRLAMLRRRAQRNVWRPECGSHRGG